MKPCAIHDVMMGGKGTATECTHLVCPECEKAVEENRSLREALEEIYKAPTGGNPEALNLRTYAANALIHGKWTGKELGGK